MATGAEGPAQPSTAPGAGTQVGPRPPCSLVFSDPDGSGLKGRPLPCLCCLGVPLQLGEQGLVGFGPTSLLPLTQVIEAAVLGEDRVSLLPRPFQNVTGRDFWPIAEPSQHGAAMRLPSSSFARRSSSGRSALTVSPVSASAQSRKASRASTAASGGASWTRVRLRRAIAATTAASRGRIFPDTRSLVTLASARSCSRLHASGSATSSGARPACSLQERTVRRSSPRDSAAASTPATAARATASARTSSAYLRGIGTARLMLSWRAS